MQTPPAAAADRTFRYFLRTPWAAWTEVTKAEWVKAELSAGFRGGREREGEPATNGFSNGGVEGSVISSSASPPDYDFNPDLRDAAWPPAHTVPTDA